MKQAKRAAGANSERQLRLTLLGRLATDLFNGDRSAADRWLVSPQPAFGGRVPAHMAATAGGAAEVRSLIRKLDHGVVV